MQRREFIAAIGGATFAWPRTGRTQQLPRSKRVGILAAGASALKDYPPWAEFEQGIRELGYIQGRNLVLEGRFAEGDLERLPTLAAELAAMKVDVIVILGPAPMRAAKAAAADIPIVMVAGSSDTIGEGFIASFARPGGNITGLTYAVSSERFGKPLEILKEAIDPMSRVAVLWDDDIELFRRAWAPALEQAARQLGLQIGGPFLVRARDDLDLTFAAMAEWRAEAALVATSGIIYQNRSRLAELANSHRLPVMAAFRDLAAAGSLMSYGPNLAAIYRRVPVYVDKILKGERPGDIPVEQPTKFDLVINLKTARALAVHFPASILARADEVIE